MKFLRQLTAVTLFILNGTRLNGQLIDFCYLEQSCGPSSWPGTCLQGSNQSPIDLHYEHTNHNYNSHGSEADLFQSYENFVDQKFNLTNNGNTIQVSFNDDLTSTILLEGSLLGGKYVFSQLHFHWGSSNDRGSEHTLNQKRYPMEAHLVYYSADYKNLTEAMNSNKAGAIAVIGVFFKISDRNNSALTPIIDAMNNVRNVNSKTSGDNLRLSKFLFGPDFKGKDGAMDVIQYHGSLTTPTCSEVVLWNLVAQPAPISLEQLRAFRTLILTRNGRQLVDNYRPPQNRSGRDTLALHVRSSVMQ